MNAFIRCVIALGVMALSAASAVAEDKFPSKPLKLVVPLAAGGGNDAVARILAESMAKHLGQAVIVENRTGAGGNVGTDFVAKSPADGYTLIHVSNSVVVNPYLYKKLPFDIQKDLMSVGLIATTPMFILAHPSSSVTNLRELIDQMKSESSKLSYATKWNAASLCDGAAQDACWGKSCARALQGGSSSGHRCGGGASSDFGFDLSVGG